MNGVGFEILAHTPVPQLPPSYPTETQTSISVIILGHQFERYISQA